MQNIIDYNNLYFNRKSSWMYQIHSQIFIIFSYFIYTISTENIFYNRITNNCVIKLKYFAILYFIVTCIITKIILKFFIKFKLISEVEFFLYMIHYNL